MSGQLVNKMQRRFEPAFYFHEHIYMFMRFTHGAL